MPGKQPTAFYHLLLEFGRVFACLAGKGKRFDEGGSCSSSTAEEWMLS